MTPIVMMLNAEKKVHRQTNGPVNQVEPVSYVKTNGLAITFKILR